jgi:hypothetical protein
MKSVNPIGLREQLAFMRLHWPDFTTRVYKGQLIAKGDLQPDELCRIYRVEIRLPCDGAPEVRVLNPALRPRSPSEAIPHMYDQERLCLYLPGSGEWAPYKAIALTIVPWASLWLYFYEVWHATGVWLGGGVEPNSQPKLPLSRENQQHE